MQGFKWQISKRLKQAMRERDIDNLTLVRRTDALVSRRLTALVSVFSVLRCISVACVLSAALLLSATAVLLAAVRLSAIRSFVSFAAPVVNTKDISCVDSVLSLSVSRICVG